MILKFQGVVQLGDEFRVDEEGLNGSVHIGDSDLVWELDNAKFTGRVTVGILDERFDGELSVDTGWGYSEYTPMDPDVLSIGDHDLLEIIRRYNEQYITVFVADEPFNILE